MIYYGNVGDARQHLSGTEMRCEKCSKGFWLADGGQSQVRCTRCGGTCAQTGRVMVQGKIIQAEAKGPRLYNG